LKTNTIYDNFSTISSTNNVNRYGSCQGSIDISWSVWTTTQNFKESVLKALHGGGDTTYMCLFLPKSWKCQTKTQQKKLKLESGIYCRFFF
jgi:hypothetical protein